MLRSLCTVLLVLALACGGAPTQGKGKGTVVGVDAAKREITLDHGDIPGVMKAMTMTFSVRDPKLLEGLAPGAKVEFEVEQVGADVVVTAVRAR